MNEMVERAARAMCIADKRDPDSPAPHEGEVALPYWRFYANYALIAISAIREPTDAVAEAAAEGLWKSLRRKDDPDSFGFQSLHDAVRLPWVESARWAIRAAIDAAVAG